MIRCASNPSGTLYPPKTFCPCYDYGVINQKQMKFTKAQSVIIEEIGNTNSVNNYAQRMRAIQPMLDAKVISRTVIYDNGYPVDYHWELV